MNDLSRYAGRPISFVLHYVQQRRWSHVIILASVLAAVACAIGSQYGIKFLVDALARGPDAGLAWIAFGLLASLIALDNMLWRLAGWKAGATFVGVTGDLRRDLFRHVTGHAPSYFLERQPEVLTSRITATSNATF